MLEFARKILARKAAKVLLAFILTSAGLGGIVTANPALIDAIIEVAAVLVEGAGQ